MRTFPRAASRARPPRRLPRENRCPAQTQNASCAVIAVPTRHETPPAQRSPSRPDPERPRAKAAVPPGHKTFLRENRPPAQALNVPRVKIAVPTRHETPPAQRSPSRPDPERPRAKAAVPPGHKTFLRENRPPAQALNVHAQRLPPRPDTKRSCGHGPARHAPSACIYPAGSASAVRVPADTPRDMPARVRDKPRGVPPRCPASPLMPMNAPRGMSLRNVPAPADAPEAPSDRTRAACPFALQRPSLILSQSHVYAACPEQWPRGPSLPTGALRANAFPVPRETRGKSPRREPTDRLQR